MEFALARPYPAVRTGQSLSYGGSQNWFPEESFRACGCGVIACADTLLYLTGRDVLAREDYLRYVAGLRRFFPLIPRRGIDGMRMALGLNLCLSRSGLPIRGRWSVSCEKFSRRLTEMLEDDLPVIMAVGPNFPKVWGTERLPLYRKTAEGAYAVAERTKGHFLTATGVDEEWIRVSSWGQKLYISRKDYDLYKKRYGALFSNLLLLRRSDRLIK